MRTDDDLRAFLAGARRIAVLGAHPDPAKPAHYVPDYLHQRGYRIIPVNPVYAGQVLWGEPVRASLLEVREPVDVLDVFRRSEQITEHVDEILALRPALAWLQSGIRNDPAARALEGTGIAVVQDRCLMVEHRRLLG
jgi:predicted CoA-binding protein